MIGHRGRTSLLLSIEPHLSELQQNRMLCMNQTGIDIDQQVPPRRRCPRERSIPGASRPSLGRHRGRCRGGPLLYIPSTDSSHHFLPSPSLSFLLFLPFTFRSVLCPAAGAPYHF